jgi:hypothetical protein
VNASIFITFERFVSELTPIFVEIYLSVRLLADQGRQFLLPKQNIMPFRFKKKKNIMPVPRTVHMFIVYKRNTRRDQPNPISQRIKVTDHGSIISN